MEDNILGEWPEDEKPLDDISLKEFDGLLQALFLARNMKDECETELKLRSESLRELESKVLGYMNHFGKDRYPVPGYGTIYVTRRFSVKQPADPEAKEKFYDYLRAIGVFEDLISVHSRTLNSFYKEQMEANEGNADFKIPGLDEPSFHESIAIRKN